MFRQLGLLAVLALVAVAFAPATGPVSVSYVYSDSMEPTMAVDDGVVLVPAGDVAVGDVVTFRSPQRDGFATHRIVGRTDRGFVTKGDNNEATDQEAGYPHVPRDDIVGRVFTVDGRPLVIPHLGDVVRTLREGKLLLLGAFGVTLVWRGLAGDDREDGTTRVVTGNDVARPLLVATFVALVAAFLLGGTVHEQPYVAVEGGSGSPETIPVGEATTVDLTVNRTASPLTMHVVRAEGLTATAVERTARNVTISGTLPPPSAPGPVRVRVAVRQYPRLLPRSTLSSLLAVHPVLPATAIAAIVVAPLALLVAVFVDGDVPVRPSHRRWKWLDRRRGL